MRSVGILAAHSASSVVARASNTTHLEENIFLDPANTGLEVTDLAEEPGFLDRRVSTRNLALQLEGFRRLTRAFVEQPDTLFQELVNVAVELCGADSAGISLQQEAGSDEAYYRWVATAGDYAHFLHATLPRYPSACGICLERGRPQRFRVSKSFFDHLGVDAPTVTDGLLLPWQVDEVQGTIFIMAHGRTDAFHGEDLALMEVLADFTAMITRHQRQQMELVRQATLTAAAAMANDLAHEINNPLQSLTNLVYLSARSREDGGSARALAQELSEPLQRLSQLVSSLLALPTEAIRGVTRTGNHLPSAAARLAASAAPEHSPAAR